MPALPFCRVRLSARKPKVFRRLNSLETPGDHLRKKRLDLGLLQRDAAQTLGVGATTLASWEAGRRHPTIRWFPRLTRFLGYTPFPAPRSLSERLVACRRTLGLSRVRCAALIGIDPGTLARWEAGAASQIGSSREKIEAFLKKMEQAGE